MGSSPTGHPTKKSAVFNSGLFLCGCPVGLEKHGTAAGRATNSPVGCLLVRGSQPFGMSIGVPHSSCFQQRTFFMWVPSGTRKARHCRRQGSKQPSGLFVSARVPTIRNVYRGSRSLWWGTQLARTQNHRYSSGGVHHLMDASAFSLTGSSAAGSLRSHWWCSPLSAGHWQWTCHSCHGCAAVPP